MRLISFKEKMKRKCVYCAHLINGRSDKKFCGDSCRNSYNNDKNRDRNLLVKKFHQRLQKNHRILNTFLQDKTEKKVFKIALVEAGFNLQSVSSYTSDPQGVAYFFVYDIGFRILDEHIIHLTRSTNKGFEVAGLTG